MDQKKNKYFIIMILVVCFLFSVLWGCSTPSSDTSDSGTNDSNKDLEIKSIYWVDDGSGFLQYYTNDTNNCNTWSYSCPSVNIPSMNTSEIQIKKISGSSSVGFGIVFCVQDYNNLYRILIVKGGCYRIEKRIGGVWSYNYNDGNGWVSSSNLSWHYTTKINQGYDVLNTIKVTRIDSSFSLYFNNVLEVTYTDNSFTSGYTGGCTGVGGTYSTVNENFPNTPVDVRFKLITAN